MYNFTKLRTCFNNRGVLKIRFFEADKILKPEFTIVNEDFKIEVQR